MPRRETPVETRQRLAGFLSRFGMSPSRCYCSRIYISDADLLLFFLLYGTVPPRRVCPRAVSPLERLASRLARRNSRSEGSGSAPLLFAPTCLIHIDRRSETRVTVRRCGIRGGKGDLMGGKGDGAGRFIIGNNYLRIIVLQSVFRRSLHCLFVPKEP